MKRLTKRPSRHALACSAALVLGLAAGTPAWAIYKIVGPDGSVTFSDVPPGNTQGKAVQSLPAGNSAAPDRFAGFPAALREAARKYPVTLYTAPQCEACDAARDYLIRRGIPFAEKTITTQADIKAYKTLSNGSDQLPLLIIGSTKLNTGFSSGNWGIALDAAGYPKKSELPRGYVRPQPAALAPTPAQKASGPETRSAPTEPSVLPPPNPNAPKGFQF